MATGHDPGLMKEKSLNPDAKRPRLDDPDSLKGLYRKFDVRRHDPDNKHVGCFYFVLDLDHDQFASDALETYADKCSKRYPYLASDLRGIIKRARITQSGGNG